MKKRIKKKYANIDAGGVKEIAEMQRYIDNLENFLWRMAQCTQGVDDCQSILKFAANTSVEIAVDRIWEFIMKHSKKKDANIEKIELDLTCGSCPEQYDAFIKDETGERVCIGYIRLRHGHLTCEYLPTHKLDEHSILVYEHIWEKDEYKGEFDCEEERAVFLKACKESLWIKHKEMTSK